MLVCFTFAKLGSFVKPKNIFYFFTTQYLGAVAADLLYKPVPGFCLIVSRAVRYLPKLAQTTFPLYAHHPTISI